MEAIKLEGTSYFENLYKEEDHEPVNLVFDPTYPMLDDDILSNLS